jgi:hypothetical protein
MATIEATGAETGLYLSHANDSLFLQNGVQGLGEEFFSQFSDDGNVYFGCLGGESGNYLSHADNSVSLQNGQGASEERTLFDQ